MTPEEEQKLAAKEFIEPLAMEANDRRVLVNGNPLSVDFRIISEGQYQYLISLMNFKSALREEIEKRLNFINDSEGDIDKGARLGYKDTLELLDSLTPRS